MSTRVVSFRMTEREYNEMMLECHQKGIGSSEWVQQKIAFANRGNEILRKVKFKLNSIRRMFTFKKNCSEIYDSMLQLIDYFEIIDNK